MVREASILISYVEQIKMLKISILLSFFLHIKMLKISALIQLIAKH